MAVSDNARWFNLNDPYRYRDDNLRALGFGSYRAYLESPLWASIRIRVLERSGGKCEACSKRIAAQIHHRAYDPATLRGDSIDALNAVCFRCHTIAEKRQKLHGSDKGQRGYQRLMKASDKILRRARKRSKGAVRDAARPRLVKVS